MKRTMTAAVAALTVSVLAGCGSSASSVAPAPSSHPTGTHSASATSRSASAAPTPTAKVTTVSDSQRWQHSLCSKLHVSDVARAVGGIPKKQNKSVHSEIGYLTTDYCQFDLVTSSPDNTGVSYGTSARTWSVADWEQLKKNSLQGATTLKSVKLGAHGAMVDGNIGWVLVGNRILSVLAPYKAPERQVTALMKLALPEVTSVQPLPALLGLPECGKANAQAAAVIGGPATVRRDEKIDGLRGPVVMCGWATRGGSVSIEGQDGFSTSAQTVRQEATRVKSAQPVNGLGAAAVYFPDNAELHVATKGYKIILNSSGTHTNKKRLVALAHAVLDNY